MIYAEHYFYKTGKEYIEKAKQIYEKNPETPGRKKFDLKYGNFLKKSGFYEEALEKIK